MDTADIVWIVVAALVVLALVALVLFLLRKRKATAERHRVQHAEQLRHEAATRTEDVHRSELDAREAQLEAERLRLEAERAEHRATETHRHAAHEQAAQEDVVRRADETDPRVDTRADDYRPITGPDMKGGHGPS